MEAALVQDGRNLRIGVVIQRPIDLLHHLETGRPLLPGIEWNRDREGPGNPTLESKVGRDLIVSDQRHVLQDEPDQPLSLAIRGVRIPPYGWKVAGQGCDPGTVLLSERNPITLAALLILLLGRSQRPELIIPVSLEGIGDKTVGRVDMQIASLGQVGFVLSSFHCFLP
jgi:hypothetical protein